LVSARTEASAVGQRDRGAGLGEFVLGDGQLGAPSLLPGRVAGLRLSAGVGDEVVLSR
jgi:hypothetical protein